MIIDSHQHFWQYHPVKDAWITDDMKVIQQDFLPADLWPLLQANQVQGCVAVQADQSEAETAFLLQLAQQHEWIKGVVGWVDLRAENIEERLQYFAQHKKLKGFRHIVQAEQDPDFLLGAHFCRGIEQLAIHGFTYDLLIVPHQLAQALVFVKKFPQLRIVIDHLAKPDFKQADLAQWEKGIRALADCPNVYCKLSGMVTEADWQHWKLEDFVHALNVVTEAFGTDRLLFGSDWPVCLLAANYSQCIQIVKDYFSTFTPTEQHNVLAKNAIEFYTL